MAIYVVSDLHLNHKNIINMGRPFETLQEHNDYVIEEYNKVVGKDDLVYILGDVGFSPVQDLKLLIPRLNGRKVLILGNHDKQKIGEYRNMGFIEVYDHPVYYSSHLILSHEPVREALNNPYVFNVHGHLHFNILDLPNYINVNTELINYKPISLVKLEEYAAKRIKSRRENFGQEWYFEYYKKSNTSPIIDDIRKNEQNNKNN